GPVERDRTRSFPEPPPPVGRASSKVRGSPFPGLLLLRPHRKGLFFALPTLGDSDAVVQPSQWTGQPPVQVAEQAHGRRHHHRANECGIHRTAKARPTPMIFRNSSPELPIAIRTTPSSRAALVMILPVRCRPSCTERVLSPLRR